MEEEAEEPAITREEAQTVENNCADPVILSCSDKLDEFFYQERKKNEKQGKLTILFSIV